MAAMTRARSAMARFAWADSWHRRAGQYGDGWLRITARLTIFHTG
jgi:hypothetical protein